MTSNIEKIREAEEQTSTLITQERELREEAMEDGTIDNEEQAELDRIRSKIDDLETVVTGLRAEFEENKALWESRSGELTAFQNKLAELHAWTHIPCDLLDATMRETEEAAAAEDYATANAHLTQGSTNIDSAHEEYVTESTAKEAFDPRWQAAQDRLAASSASEHEALAPLQSQMVEAQNAIEASIGEGKYVEATEMLDSLEPILDEYEEQLATEEARVEFEAALAAVQPDMDRYALSSAEWEFMADKTARLGELRDRMTAECDADDYETAHATLVEIQTQIAEMDTAVEAHGRYEVASETAETKLAEIAAEGEFPDLQSGYDAILAVQANATAAADAGDWDSAAGLMDEVVSLCGNHMALITAQKDFLSMIETRLPALKTKSGTLASATSPKKERADALIVTIERARDTRTGLTEAVSNLDEVATLLEECEVIASMVTRLDAAAPEDRDDIAREIVEADGFDISDVPTEGRNILVEALMGGDSVEDDEHAAIAAIWSEEDFVDREFDRIESEQRERIVAAIANDPDVINMSREWDTYTDEEKREAYERLARIPAEEWGIDTPPVDVRSEDWQPRAGGGQTITLGSYSPGSDEMWMNVSDDAETHADFSKRMGTLVHEIGHKYQEHIEQQYRDGTLEPDSPIYQQARSHFLDDEYQSQYPDEFRELYRTSPDEAHSRNMGHEMQEAMDRALAEAEARAAEEAGDAEGEEEDEAVGM